jgi:hypothetical protein
MESEASPRPSYRLVRIEGWLVYRKSGRHLGPVSAELVARGIAAGKMPRDAYVTVVGASHWRPALDVPEVRRALDDVEWEYATTKK